MAIIMEFYSGTARVQIADDCLPKTAEENERRLRQVDAAIHMIDRNHRRRMMEQMRKERNGEHESGVPAGG